MSRDREPKYTARIFDRNSVSYTQKRNMWTDQSSEPPETPSLFEDFCVDLSIILSTPCIFLCSIFSENFFYYYSFFSVSFAEVMPMLEKLSMPLAVRLAGITNCHVFVHALRTIKWKISYLQYNSHVITHIH